MTTRRSMAFPHEDELALRWAIIGDAGAVEFQGIAHCVGMNDRDAYNLSFKPYGIEYHFRTPPEYSAGKPADHENCWLIGGPCWHDGSSMAADDLTSHTICCNRFASIWSWLEQRYTEMFGPEEHSHKEAFVQAKEVATDE